MNTAGNLGGVVAPMVVGFVVAQYGSWNVPFYISAGIYTMGAVLWLAIDPQMKLA
jgi:nitrate/nitrite transporter NarK